MKTKITFTFLFLICAFHLFAQRRMENMDRGVVAMPTSSSQIYISWRHFATDPDDITYNVYYKTSASGALTKLNGTPIFGSTNYTATLSTSASLYTFSVKSVLNGVEKDEPGSFTVPRSTAITRIVKDYNFAAIPGSTVAMDMKFCWPADLDGDGKYDFVMDRQNYGAIEEDGSGGSADYPSPKVEAYSSEGVFLWRVDMGPNIKICSGQNDMVTAYDMNGDGKAEVLMIVGEGTTFADGKTITGANGQVTNYRSIAGSAPQWLSILDGQTGIELDRIDIPFFDELSTTRTDTWKEMGGHFIIAYLDGINPSLIYEYKNRLKDDSFQGAEAAWRFINGKLTLQWAYMNEPDLAQFHQVRVGDVDGDGCDEFVEGGYVVDHDGTLLNRHKNIVHGDRHVLADIDPDRPGLEHFVIQQDNPKSLGMGIYDAVTGEIIKGAYQSAKGDVGRGTCGAFDPTRRGLQFFSTMNSNAMYDCKGNLTGGMGNFPGEALWWDGDLSREEVNGADENGKNLVISKYSSSSKTTGRHLSLYQDTGGKSSYYYKGAFGARPAFWGDILGDWREEMICVRSDMSGFVILSTNIPTTHRIYNLMQNPAYRCQTTARGYYETADVDYYFAEDMPKPPIAPVQKADLYYTGTGWVDYDNIAGVYADGKSIMFDIRGGNSTYTLNSNMSPSRLWLMNPKGKNYAFNGTGKFTGTMDVVKSMQGDVTFNGNYDYTGITRISEGRLFVNGVLTSKVQVDARGVIGGDATLNGGISLETGLNVEGGRIEPGISGTLGSLTIVGNLDLPGRNNLAFDTDQTQAAKSDLLHIQGDFNVTGTNHAIIINPVTAITAGTLTLVTFTGTTNATAANFKVLGLEGIPYTLFFESGVIKLEIREPRAATAITWKGDYNAIWDFETNNFLSDSGEDIFVPGDVVTFNDQATRKIITINETMPVSNLVFNNDADYEINGSGIISGTAGLTKTGTGKLSLKTTDNTFTGAIVVENSVLEVSSLKDGGLSSSIGASSSDASNWIMKNATLQTTSQMATDRNMQVEGNLKVNNPASNNSVMISGNILGSGISLDVAGKGTLSLQGKNQFSTVTLHDGLLYLSSSDANRYSLGNAKINLLSGTFRLFDIDSGSDTGTFTNDIEVPAGASVKWDLPSRWGISGKLTGSGTIQVNILYSRSDFNGDWKEFSGIINYTKGGKYGDVRLNSATSRNLSNAEVNLGSETYLCVASNGSTEVSTGQTIYLGALSGSGSISGINSLEIGNKNTNTTYSGVISAGTGKLTKKGEGSLTLTGANLYTGGTTVNAGKLIVGNTTGSATGTGAVMTYNNSVLGGTGTISGNVTMYGQSGIDMQNAKFETLTIGKDLRLTSGGSVTLDVSRDGKNSSDCIKVNGIIYLNNSTLNLNPDKETGSFAIGYSYKILNASTINGTFVTINPVLPEGMAWDQSQISSGIIQIVPATGIADINAENITVYPNPVQDNAFINMGGLTGKVVVECISVNGACVQKQEFKSAGGIETIDFSKLSSGSYLLKIYSEDYLVITKKIIKQ